MIISHEHRYLFVQVPATGSTAIGHELRQHYAGQSICYKHANYSEFKRTATPEERQYFAFAGVRNPLDALVSHYIRLKTNYHGVYTNPQKFERNGGWIPDAHLERFDFIHQKKADFPQFFRRFYRTVHHEWVLLGHKELDLIIRFETLQADFERAINLIGLRQVRPLPGRNRSGRADRFEDYYTPDIYQQAVRVFGPFMKKWGYSFPKEWNVDSIPTKSLVGFKVIDNATNLAARYVCLSPQSHALRRMKTGLRHFGLS